MTLNVKDDIHQHNGSIVQNFVSLVALRENNFIISKNGHLQADIKTDMLGS